MYNCLLFWSRVIQVAFKVVVIIITPECRINEEVLKVFISIITPEDTAFLTYCPFILFPLIWLTLSHVVVEIMPYLRRRNKKIQLN